MLGLINPCDAPPSIQTSPFEVIPKSGVPGKLQLIVDLSSPEGKSVNDGIEPELCTLQYLRLYEVVEQVVRAGYGAVLAKMDIKSAYRIVPVHPDDRPLLGMLWKGVLYFNKYLPFGLRSAPKIFSALANALQWVFQQSGVMWIRHYLDDFVTVGTPSTQECNSNMELMLESCKGLRVPVAPAKCTSPAPVMVLLGFELDTIQMTVWLPVEKLQQTLALVREWAGRKACKKRELESLLGYLHHAAKVVLPGHTSVCRLIELL